MKKRCKKLVALSIVLSMSIMLGCQNSDSSVEQPSSDEVVSSEVVEEAQIDYATASAEELAEWIKGNPKDMEAIRAYIGAKGYADSLTVDENKALIMQKVLPDSESKYAYEYQEYVPNIYCDNYSVQGDWQMLAAYESQLDENGKVVYVSQASVGHENCKDVSIKYDDNGNVTKISAIADIWGEDRKVEFFYENGKILQKTIDGNTNEKYTYNANGQLTKEEYYFMDYEYPYISKYTPVSVTYDANASEVRVKFQEYDDFIGEVIGEQERTYIVDANIPMEYHSFENGYCVARMTWEDGSVEERFYRESENGEPSTYNSTRYSAEGVLMEEGSHPDAIYSYYENGMVKTVTDFSGQLLCDSTETYDSATDEYEYTYQFYDLLWNENHWGWLNEEVKTGASTMTLRYKATDASAVDTSDNYAYRRPGNYEKTFYDAQNNIICIDEFLINAWGENEYFITTTFDGEGNPTYNIIYNYIAYSENGTAARVKDFVFVLTQNAESSSFIDTNDKRKEEDFLDVTYYFSESIQN
ncbi:MAG: hypothetical protein IJA29_06950 [Lachnospiraceae bacterium]|nr:hypothetical protein [Lachnospiraceae bacterium]